MRDTAPWAEHAAEAVTRRRLAPDRRRSLTRGWDRHPHGKFAGRTVVVVGMGAIGRDLARKAKACHRTVVGAARRHHDTIRDVDLVVTADFLVVRRLSPQRPRNW
ncbi:NAD(P)-dependent oxidoreductase [Streptomyces sp. ME19-01-6]|uniref:NAD(P)-dependent oxidoreductase n=1 Tax=Streptomyces sp. ME19-01-6 TaxID=3028686 RepID=UPI0039F4550F